MTKRRTIPMTLIALLTLALGASPAGATTINSGNSPGGSGNSATVGMYVGTGAKALKFVACVRSHGVPNFPDPNSSGVIQVSSSSGINPNSSQFVAAQKACQKFLSRGGKMTPAQQAKALAKALKFSQCMRSHGVPGFPDPTTSGGGVSFQIKGSSGSSLDPNSPAFQAASKACQKYNIGAGLPAVAK